MNIRHRIALWVAGAGLLTSLAFSLVVFWDLREQLLKMTDSQLKATAVSVARQLARVQTLPAGGREIAWLPPSERYWITVYDRNLHPVYQSELSKVVDIPLNRDMDDEGRMIRARVPKHRDDFHQDEKDEVTFRVRVIAEDIAGAPCLIQIAKPVEDLEEENFDILAAIGIGMAVSTALLAGLSYMLAGQIVKPLTAIILLARDINENTLEKRIPLGRSHDEIHELATRLNHMFDRLQFSFARQKQFLADASHELKSPITVLRLFFEEAIRHRDLPETFRRQLDAQRHNVLRMDRLVRTLLELSILEMKASLVPEPFNLAALARSVAEDFAPLMERLGIRLKSEIPGQLEIWGDRDKVHRALINIFDNAVKYNEEEGLIQFTVAERKDRIHLSLCNTGPGIPKEDLPKVFNQFYRVDKSRSTEYGGAGLGLSMVREIVRLHKGTISIDSQGLWTRVEIFLPRNQEEPCFT